MTRNIQTVTVPLVTALGSTDLPQAAQAQSLLGWVYCQPVNVPVDVTKESGEPVQVYFWDRRQHLVDLPIGGGTRLFVPGGNILLHVWFSQSRTWQTLYVHMHQPFGWTINEDQVLGPVARFGSPHDQRRGGGQQRVE